MKRGGIYTYKDLKLIKSGVFKFLSPQSRKLWLYETNETSLAQHFIRNFLIQLV